MILIYIAIYIILFSFLSYCIEKRIDPVKPIIFSLIDVLEKVGEGTRNVLFFWKAPEEYHTILPSKAWPVPKIESITAGLNTEQLKRFNKAIVQLGINFKEAEKTLLDLKTVLDKVCDGK